MSLHTRLSAVQRERGRRCSACGGPIVPATRSKTWQAVMEDYRNLPEVEHVAMAVHNGHLDHLPPSLQEQAYRLYCQQQGIEYDWRSTPYSSPNPPPAPSFPAEGPLPTLPRRFG